MARRGKRPGLTPELVAARQDGRRQRQARERAFVDCSACHRPLSGRGAGGLCADCIAAASKYSPRPRPGTRHARRRAAGISRSRAGR